LSFKSILNENYNCRTNTSLAMKKITMNYVASFLTAAIVLSSCGGLNKMKETAGTMKPTVVPEILEMKGGQVEMTVKGNFPPKFFNKKAVLEVTPVLKYANGETAYQSKTFQGEKVEANNTVIKYKEGGAYEITGKVPYTEDMMLSELVLKLNASLKDQKVDFGTIPVGNGVKATSTLVQKEAKVLTLPDNFKRVTGSSYDAQILYEINKANIRSSELKKADVKGLDKYIKETTKNPNTKLTGIQISSYASPDGPEKLNAKLADGRKTSADKFLVDQLKKDKELKKTFTKSKIDSLFSLLSTPEDWDGFKTLMEKSTIKDKDLVLRVLSMYSDPEVREKEIKNISSAFEEIAEKILPQLRRSKMMVKVDLIGRSDEEIKKTAAGNPDTLSLEELLYAGNLIQDLNSKASVYQAAVKKYGNDVRGHNNLGVVYFKQGKIADAKAEFEAAKAISETDVVKNNLGAVALAENDNAKAEELFTSAMGAGEVVNYNLGIIKIIDGDYDKAVNYYGNACEFNAALAQLLSGKPEVAVKTLGCVKEETPLVDYLKAVAGARTNNNDLMFSNLRNASKDAKLKARAVKDAEFFKFYKDETFLSIVK
jgi:tetratricopeptide (TPR) repeat protein